MVERPNLSSSGFGYMLVNGFLSHEGTPNHQVVMDDHVGLVNLW